MDALKTEELAKVPKLRLALKNAILHHLTQNRKLQTMNSLSTVLKSAVNKAKKKKLEK